MPSLDNLKKKLYQPEGDKEFHKRLEYKFNPEQEPKKLKKPLLTPQIKKWLKYSLIAGGATILIGAGIIFLTRNTSFDQAKVYIKFDGSQKIESGEFLKYDFTIKNDNPLALEHAKLIIDYPEGSRLQNPDIAESQDEINIGRLKGGEEKTVSSYVKVFGPEDEKYVVSYKLSYLPSSLNSSLDKKGDFAVDIIASPLKLVIDEPKIITLGKDLVYTIHLTNDSLDSFKNIRLNVQYPTGFSITKFSPRHPDIENHAWEIPTLAPRDQKEFQITGKLSQELEIINFEIAAQLQNDQGGYQTYSTAYSAVSLTPAPIKIDIQPTNLSIPDIVNVGSNINFIINFQNTTDSILRDIVLTFEPHGEIFDFNSVSPSDIGIYQKENRQVLWDSRRIPKLAILNPFEASSAQVGIQVKSILPLASYDDKNFTGSVTARVKVNNIPPELSGIQLVDTAEASVKVNSVLDLRTRILNSFSQSSLSATGPRPPQVGKKTEYLIAWQLLNYYNDLSNVTIESYLPQGVYWEEAWWPEDNNITFDPLTGRILWQLDELRAGAGFISPVKQVVFKISTIPSPSQRGGKITLVGETTARGKDSFTNQNLSDTTRQLETAKVLP
jgi:hypothetical protein